MICNHGRLLAVGLALSVLLGTMELGFGQGVTTPRVPAQTPAAAPVTTVTHDRFITAWLSIDNNGEIAINRLAEQKSGNQDIKNFAQTMIREHTDFANKLQQVLTASAAAGMGTHSDTPGMARNVPGTPGTISRDPVSGQYSAGFRGPQPLGGAAAPAAGQLDPLRLKHDIAQQILALTERDLNHRQGVDFDRAFLHQQMGAHLHILGSLDVARNHVSPQLRQVLDEGIATTQKHLDHIRSLLARVEPGEHR